MGIGERERHLSEMKRITISGCKECKDFNNAEKTQERLAKLRDFYPDLRSAGIFLGSKKDWIEKYDGLIGLCKLCTQKVREVEYCSGSDYAIELRDTLE